VDYKSIGKNIQRTRLKKNMTQVKLAQKIGISNNHLSRIETGAGTMSIETLIALSNALETTPDYLLLGCYTITPDRASLIISEKLKELSQENIAYIIGAADLFREVEAITEK
jgi:transcriptional regulator with XRE-family HTH domain